MRERYADFVPMGATVTPMRSTDSIMWTVKFRSGMVKRFKFPIRTTPEGSIDPYGGKPDAEFGKITEPGFGDRDIDACRQRLQQRQHRQQAIDRDLDRTGKGNRLQVHLRAGDQLEPAVADAEEVSADDDVPELIQDEMSVTGVVTEALGLLNDGRRAERMRAGLEEVRARLGGGGASRRAAEEVMSFIKGNYSRSENKSGVK